MERKRYMFLVLGNSIVNIATYNVYYFNFVSSAVNHFLKWRTREVPDIPASTDMRVHAAEM